MPSKSLRQSPKIWLLTLGLACTTLSLSAQERRSSSSGVRGNVQKATAQTRTPGGHKPYLIPIEFREKTQSDAVRNVTPRSTKQPVQPNAVEEIKDKGLIKFEKTYSAPGIDRRDLDAAAINDISVVVEFSEGITPIVGETALATLVRSYNLRIAQRFEPNAENHAGLVLKVRKKEDIMFLLQDLFNNGEVHSVELKLHK